MLSVDEAVKMQGEEFLYIFKDRKDTINAYVKKFDPKKGFSCWSFGLITDKGYKFDPKNKDEAAEGAFCVIGIDLEDEPEKLYLALEILEEIKLTGKRQSKPRHGSFFGCPL